ncbi:class I SAM-dependent methyltransferase [Cytophagaceae bacterium ABcell3]|nr:class I SAM-dependent methyltransferase [Cytophagaceae bacterium ABcell3]
MVQLINPYNKEKLVKQATGHLADRSGAVFEFKHGAYRFVDSANYADNFSFQWNLFDKVQLDNHSQSNISRERFFGVTGWDKNNLKGKDLLEVGSGAGRFSQVVLQHTEANLYSVDYSNAVEANFNNNGPHERLHLFQASIYDLPFAKASFDKVFCFGVLQHTPDFEKSIACLVDMVKPGGELVVDFYPILGWWTKLHAKYLFRPFTRKMAPEKLYSLINTHAGWLIKLSKTLHNIGLGAFTRFLPICDIRNTLPKNLSKKQLREWVVLDTFDMFSPRYDNPQKVSMVVSWFKKYGMKNVSGGAVTYYQDLKCYYVKGCK